MTSRLLSNPVFTSSALGLRLAPPERVRLLAKTFGVPPYLEEEQNNNNNKDNVVETDIDVLQEGVFFNPTTQEYEFYLHYPHAKEVSIYIGGGVEDDIFQQSKKKFIDEHQTNIVTNILPRASNPLTHTTFIHYNTNENPKAIKYWHGSVYFPVGLTTYCILLEKNDVLSPFLPVSVNRCRPSHFVDRPPAELVAAAKKVDTNNKNEKEIEAVLEKHPYIMNTDRDFPRGGLVEEYIYCDRTQSLQRLLVYVPASYFSKNNNNKSYPVLYLQHGVGGNENQWTQFGKLPHLMDNLMHRGGCKEMLVVMGDGMLSRTIPNIKDETENWSNKNKQTAAVVPQHDQMDYIDFLLKNVIPFIDEKYKTIPEKEGRAVAGFSMGSAQASVCGFQHYELFSYIGLLSGFIQCEYLESLLGGNDTHLKVFKTFQKEDSEKVQSFFKETLKNKVFFRAMGEEDNFFPFFLKDDQFLAEHGIDNNSDDIIIRRTYKGSTHSWEAMRKILPDFLKLIF